MEIILKKEKKVIMINSKIHFCIPIGLFFLLLIEIIFMFARINNLMLEVFIMIFIFVKIKKTKQIKGVLLNYFSTSILLEITALIYILVLSLMWDFIISFLYLIFKVCLIISLSINANKYSLYQYLKSGYEITNYCDLDDESIRFIEKAKNKKRASYLFLKF